MKKKICILTATRAEYGLLKPLIKKLLLVDEFDVKLVTTGAHLSPEFGLTYKEIESDGTVIDEKIEILLSADTPAAISKSMGLAMISFADYFARTKPDMLIVLGDRYETLAVVMVAVNQRIPIAHLYGGDVTEGAVDDAIRHAISKLSYLHFASIAEYRNRVIQLGEHPDRVYAVGLLGIENALNESLMSKEELSESLNLDLSKPYAVATFHPVTLEENSAEKQIIELLNACEKRKEINFIFTKANADTDGRVINQLLDKVALKSDNIFVYSSLGMVRYLSSLRYAEFVIGNSSSGLMEAPSFKIPTINIGDRQKGRLRAKSVIDCEPGEQCIIEAIDLALSSTFIAKLLDIKNPYGDGNTSDKIVAVMKDYLLNDKIDLKKSFYDMKFQN